MVIDELIVSGFRKLIAEKPFARITVMDICEKASISRKAFYAHCSDKNSLLERIIHDDIVLPMRELRSLLPTREFKSAPKLLMEKFYQSIYDNRLFYENLVAHGGKELLRTMLTDVICKMNVTVLADVDMPTREREYMAYFYASSQANLVVRWIVDKWPFTPVQMARFYNQWCLHYWNTLYHFGLSEDSAQGTKQSKGPANTFSSRI